MKDHKWFMFISLALIVSSLLIYSLQLLIFKKPADTFFYLFQDLAFVPISVLLITVMMDKLLKKREKQSLLNKMNMVIGAFFIEIGNHLLAFMNTFDTGSQEMEIFLYGEKNRTDDYINRAEQYLKSHHFQLDLARGNPEELKNHMVSGRKVLMRLLENPNLLEHQSFTDLLWALSHLTDELMLRKNINRLSKNDAAHLANDMNRAYTALLREWISYMKHLKVYYPYMFSLAMRQNPFDKNAKVEFD